MFFESEKSNINFKLWLCSRFDNWYRNIIFFLIF